MQKLKAGLTVVNTGERQYFAASFISESVSTPEEPVHFCNRAVASSF